jgi:kynurenine--oxoglutarate transaminase/cysteine-S-conjugate beta-lyase/glutamine--phenylpyruvate transaminase
MVSLFRQFLRLVVVWFCVLIHSSLSLLDISCKRDFRRHIHYSTVSDKSGECGFASEGSVTTHDSHPILSPPSVWTVFGDLAAKTGAVNLGQGFPDWNPPAFVLESFRDAIDSPVHQYTRPAGHPPLVELLAEKYGRRLDRKIDAFQEVAVTVGASQALYLALTVLLRPDDEIILFEPFFDLYYKQIKLTGAKPVYVPLGGASSTVEDPWALDIEALERAINHKTKVLVLNTPHNPTGKVKQLVTALISRRLYLC